VAQAPQQKTKINNNVGCFFGSVCSIILAVPLYISFCMYLLPNRHMMNAHFELHKRVCVCPLSYASDVPTSPASHTYSYTYSYTYSHSYSSVPDERGDGQYIHTHKKRLYSSDLRTSPASHDTHTLIPHAHTHPNRRKRGRTNKKRGGKRRHNKEKKEKKNQKKRCKT
jgi:hypothetical protein